MRFPLLILLLGLISCGENQMETQVETNYFDVKGLLEDQIHVLANAKAKLEKETVFDRSSDHDVTYPDSTGWRQELNTIIGLDINKPVSAGMYAVTDGLSDEGSNLSIQHTFLKDTTGVGVTDIKVFYFSTIENVRRVEIIKRERNPIYHSEFAVSMTFESLGEGLVLDGYQMQGYQKMIFMDSSTYLLNGTISL